MQSVLNALGEKRMSEWNSYYRAFLEYKKATAKDKSVQKLCEAIARSGKPLDWFKRDAAHNDDRGKQLISQTLATYFTAVEGR